MRIRLRQISFLCAVPSCAVWSNSCTRTHHYMVTHTLTDEQDEQAKFQTVPVWRTEHQLLWREGVMELFLERTYPAWPSSSWSAPSSGIWTKLSQTPWWTPGCCCLSAQCTGMLSGHWLSSQTRLPYELQQPAPLCPTAEAPRLRESFGVCLRVCVWVCVSQGTKLGWDRVKQSNHPSREWGKENMGWSYGSYPDSLTAVTSVFLEPGH